MAEKETKFDHQECNAHLAAVADALYAIGGKWKLPIIATMREGASRFNEMQRGIPGISAKVLSSELKELELNGFVKRNVYSEIPVVVEYQLTDYSHTLEPVLNALSEWGHMHRRKIRLSMKRKETV
jgi:DNA-binding HxlR family transcriptional regulator